MKSRQFNNVRVVVDGIKFDSKSEAERWFNLKLLEKAGEISDLKRQVRYNLTAHGQKICGIIPDFEYIENGVLVTEDFKSPASITDEFKLKAKLFKAQTGREIRISMKKR